MNKVIWERIKFITLIILIITSLVQVGILWSNQNHRLLFGFIPLISKGEMQAASKTDAAKEEYFTPFSIIASEGSEKNCLILSDKTNENFVSLWYEAKLYLKAIMDKSNMRSVLTDTHIDLDQWSKLVAKKSFVFQFKTNIPTNLLTWFLGINTPSSQPFDGVYKMIISPWENVNYTMATIYIRDDKSIYKYNISIDNNNNWMKREDYSKILNNIKKIKGLNEYSVIKERYNLPLIGDDVMGIVKGRNKKASFYSLSSIQPDGFKNRIYLPGELNSLAVRVIGADQNSYANIQDLDNNTVDFLSKNDFYRVYMSGILEYNNSVKTTTGDKGDIKDAFINAYDFISQLTNKVQGFGPLIDGAKPYLSGIKQNNDSKNKSGYYEFDFDYVVDDSAHMNGINNNIFGNGLPINVSYRLPYGDKSTIEHAIVIKVDSKRVLHCDALLRKFMINTHDTRKLNIDFLDIRGSAKKIKPSIFKTFISDVGIYYEIKDNKDNLKILPVCILKTDKGKEISVSMEN